MINTGTTVITDNQDQTRLITVAGLTGASGTSPPFSAGSYANATIEVQGTWDSATMLLKGSWDGGTTWIALKDIFGNAVSLTANGYFALGNLPPLLQMSWSGGDSSTSLTAYLALSRVYY